MRSFEVATRLRYSASLARSACSAAMRSLASEKTKIADSSGADGSSERPRARHQKREPSRRARRESPSMISPLASRR